MPRAVVYESPAVQAHYAELVQQAETSTLRRTENERALLEEARKKAEEGEAPPTQPTREGTQTGKDAYLEKIAKYVPAEVITLTTLAVAALNPGGDTIWWILAVGAVVNVLYLFGTALAASASPLPRWYFYALSIMAYAFWATAIIPQVGDKVGIGGDNAETEQTFALALAAFFVPLLDSIFTNLPARIGTRKTGKEPKPGTPANDAQTA
jgi:hypothetical protein